MLRGPAEMWHWCEFQHVYRLPACAAFEDRSSAEGKIVAAQCNVFCGFRVANPHSQTANL